MSFQYLKAASLAIVLSVAAVISFSFTAKPVYAASSVITNYSYEFNQAVITLDGAAESFKQGKISADSLKNTLAATRLSYKKIEFYLAFHYPEYVKGNINGAPLMQIEKEGTRPKVVVPVGLQVLDELVFSDEASEEKVQIAALAKKLRVTYGQLFNDLDKNKQAGKFGITAMRLQLVRIFTMGITGFDTPGSLNGIQETEASLTGMLSYLQEHYKNADVATITLFNNAIAQLKKPVSFDDFDRVTFFKNYIDPIYKQLGRLENDKESEYMQQTTAWNPGSNSIFSEDFLNPYFFSELKEGEDSAQLRSLGKALFFDPVLSNDGKVSCATCHQPEKGYSDGFAKSISNIQGKTVLRNAPTLLNAVYADRYFYDLRAFTLEQQAEHVIFNKDEFNTAYAAIIKKLEGQPEYANKFKTVFGKNSLTRQNFSKALASYVLSLKSFNSEFDKYMRGEIPTIAPEVTRGFNLFAGKAACATCHYSPTFSGLVPPFYNDNESEILGVLNMPEGKTLDADNGRLDNEVFTEYAWIYEKSFKTTTVRNAALTAPYFHNGAFKTLEEVVEFYNKGGGAGYGINVKNQTLSPDPLNLTEQEKKDLIAFIKSLTNVLSY
ncbi:cytochrome-c peroxidase [Flavobacterium subsaxonicum]|uniref:Cytochrome C peroxidase n=1 Tax=Flavobacterium subsaxonicum WB 4.1-42 = DSM 21790 TaxID=1121898 RepID=A0A0A2MIB4_9FLAO|nr:cytochrome c peroxidase [Flavobacterium subsaxonicum]KGO92049.1 cytochrome C peroxidase [Flavobacterium subsaxonicum WB 4.1-42 = DSM 21790]